MYIIIFYEVSIMAFKPKPTRNKIEKSYKSLYISDELVQKIEKIVMRHNTSFNNVVISILEDFFEREENEQD